MIFKEVIQWNRIENWKLKKTLPIGKAFLFSLVNKSNAPMIMRCKDLSNAVPKSSYFPTYGNHPKYDLQIAANSNTNDSSSSHLAPLTSSRSIRLVQRRRTASWPERTSFAQLTLKCFFLLMTFWLNDDFQFLLSFCKTVHFNSLETLSNKKAHRKNN